jgi:hypothetical protein
MKDSANPKIYDNRPIPVEFHDGETNDIASPVCKLFGYESVGIGQEVSINYTPKGETRFLNKTCIVRPWGKGKGEMHANIIFARERSKYPQLSDGSVLSSTFGDYMLIKTWLAPDFPSENLTLTKSLREPIFTSSDEKLRYNETFHSKEFLEYFDARLVRFHIEALEVYPQGLDSRRIHEYKFSCWVAWNSRSTSKLVYRPGG